MLPDFAMKTFSQSLRLLLVLTVITGLLYPLAVWAVGRTFFRDRAEGSLVHRHGQLVGSRLLAQKTTDAHYVWPRPSAGDYATVASGASHLTWTSTKLAAAINERQSALGHAPVPADLLTTSGSGLDPELSPAAIHIQLDRVALARGLTADQRNALDELVAENTEGGQLTPMRVNVLRLNLALDARFPLR